MGQYGIPYQGSKQQIADKIISLFPGADNFYDVFGGGFSITHAMLLRRCNDFSNFYFNEIRDGICDFIKDSIDGKYSYKNFRPKFIDKDTFLKSKDKDPYIRICWSFGNDARKYLFSKEIRPYKRSMHNAIVFNEFDSLAREVLQISSFKEEYSILDRRSFLRNKIDFYRKTNIPICLHRFIEKNDQLQRLERLEQLERLQHLQRLEQLNTINKLYYSSLSYDKISIKPNSVVYCDPPYENTFKYDGNKHYNKHEFLDWCDNLEVPVFISEYNIDDSRFRLVKLIKKRSLMSGKGTGKLMSEKVYINRYGYNNLKRKVL